MQSEIVIYSIPITSFNLNRCTRI